MSEWHHEISSYIACKNTKKITSAITKLCESEGMRLVKSTPIALSDTPSLESNYWAVAIISGRAGWHLLLSMPEALFCEQNEGGSLRFVSLCETLNTPGFVQEVNATIGDLDASGRVILETDGQGRHTISGSMWRYGMDGEGNDHLKWNGLQIREEDIEAGQRLIHNHLPATWDKDDEALSCELSDARLCGEYAQRLAGLDVSRYWQPETNAWSLLLDALRVGEALPVAKSTQLIFEWPALNRPYPAGQTKKEAARAAFWSEPRFFYSDGQDIRIGDEVQYFGGEQEKVINLMNTTREGVITAIGVFVGNDGSGRLVRADTIPARKVRPATFSRLRLLARAKNSIARPDVGYLESLAEQGNTDAQCQLGHIYTFHGDAEYNPLRANTWLRKAAKKGHAEAQYLLAWNICREIGVRWDLEKQIKLLEEAVAQGHVNAVIELVDVYSKFRTLDATLKLLHKASEQGNEFAQYGLGMCYLKGDGVVQNFEEAALLIERAATKNLPHAQAELGICYHDGKGVSQDFGRAAYWYLRSLHQIEGYSNAYEVGYRLGLLYMNGQGVERDELRARQLLEHVANNRVPVNAEAEPEELTTLASRAEAAIKRWKG
jgi:TPR repeat protein